ASQPLNVVGTPGLEEVSLAWVAPVNNGGQSIRSYVIDRRPAGGVSADDGWIRVSQEPSTTSVTVTGLEKGVAQEFRVAAKTAAGQGVWSAVSGAVTPEGTPDAPTGLAASFDPVDGSVVLNWTAPDYDGGQSIIGYVVLVSDGTGLPNPQDIPSTQTQFDTDNLLQPLSRGTTYTFSVRAKNSHGEGEVSAPIDQETADVPQAAPVITTVTPGESSVSLSWNAVPDGLLPITDYVIQQSLDEGATWTTVTDPEDIATSSTVTGLSRTDGPHIFRVAAKNVISVANESDELTWSDPTSEVTPVALATAVGNLQGVAGDGRVLLTWTAPADDGGATITDHQVEVNDGAGWQVYADGTSAITGVTVTGLANGTSYDFRVAAIT
ncbi:MAG: fibronectin type III domain-containing protein, partial [Planctomycetia bacterium]|nr:fibronectin type III domain-containing protein [Planctomycetia bacterium]